MRYGCDLTDNILRTEQRVHIEDAQLESVSEAFDYFRETYPSPRYSVHAVWLQEDEPHRLMRSGELVDSIIEFKTSGEECVTG